MIGNRTTWLLIALLLAPIAVAGWHWPVWAAILLSLALLLALWLVTLSRLLAPPKRPELELETIAASHFVEKVRWCMDRLGVDYVERPVAGVLGVFFLGRTVPRLHFTTGAVRSSIGNSPEILRYLWGRYRAEFPDRAVFLEPTEERLVLEGRIDRCGVDLQTWVYWHIIDEKSLCLHAWGAGSPLIPQWQRWLLRLCYPLLASFIKRGFDLSRKNYDKSVTRLDQLMGDAEGWLEDERGSLLGGDALNYSDITFAAIMGLWVRPPGFGGGRADTVRVEIGDCPPMMQKDIQRWRETYPRVTAFVERIYAEERFHSEARS